MDLVLHNQTKESMDSFLNHPTHALLIKGPAGSGKASVGLHLASKLLGVAVGKLSEHPYFSHIIPIDGMISIETIRTTNRFTRLKTPGKDVIKRVLLIEKAHKMTVEAQNALLKLLEEPPEDTVIILLAQPDSGLLPTITSRTRQISIKAPPKEVLVKHFLGQDYQEAAINKALAISDSQVGLMTALLDPDQTHPLIEVIEQAKHLISMPKFDRLASVDRLAKNKEQLPELLYGLGRVCRALMVQAGLKGDNKQLRRFHQAQTLILDAEASLPRNPNPKLLLTDLFLHI